MKPGEHVTIRRDGQEASGVVMLVDAEGFVLDTDDGRSLRFEFQHPSSAVSCHHCGQNLTLDEQLDATFGIRGVPVCDACGNPEQPAESQ